MSEVVAPCAACFSRLKGAIHAIDSNPELEGQIREILGMPLPRSIQVLSPLEIFSNGIDAAGAVVRELPDLKVACYYGCLLTRPPEIMEFDDCEYPMSMDNVLRSMNVTTVDWSYKTDCCGGSLAVTETDVVRKLTRDILEEAKAVGANAIAVACPLCHANLDTRQGEIEREQGTKYDLPIFYFTQLMALAMGIAAEKLGIRKHFVAADKLLAGISQG
jgi:heterodisulfide reductase subunit B